MEAKEFNELMLLLEHGYSKISNSTYDLKDYLEVYFTHVNKQENDLNSLDDVMDYLDVASDEDKGEILDYLTSDLGNDNVDEEGELEDLDEDSEDVKED